MLEKNLRYHHYIEHEVAVYAQTEPVALQRPLQPGARGDDALEEVLCDTLRERTSKYRSQYSRKKLYESCNNLNSFQKTVTYLARILIERESQPPSTRMCQDTPKDKAGKGMERQPWKASGFTGRSQKTQLIGASI